MWWRLPRKLWHFSVIGESVSVCRKVERNSDCIIGEHPPKPSTLNICRVCKHWLATKELS